MAVERSANWLSQQRVDVVDLRSLDSAVCFDFDTLAGFTMAGQQPLVVKGPQHTSRRAIECHQSGRNWIIFRGRQQLCGP